MGEGETGPEAGGDTMPETAAAAETEDPAVTMLFPEAQAHLRMLEALLFAASEPLDEATLAARMPENIALEPLLTHLASLYEARGVNLVRIGGKWAFRTAADLAFLLRKETTEQRRLSRAGIETLAIVAYHQPVTRSEIEEIRGVGVSKGTLDQLIEIGWVRPRGRRRTPGKPLTYGTTQEFLLHFGLDAVTDLPGLDDLKAAGLLDANMASDAAQREADAISGLVEDPLEDADLLGYRAPAGEEEDGA